MWFFLRQDRAEPEPRRLLVKVFFAGIGVAFLAMVVEGVIFSVIFPDQYQEGLKGDTISIGILITTILMYFLAGPIEEGLKLLGLGGFVYRKRDFNQIADGVIYGITLALGFVLVENTSYFLKLYFSLSTPLFVFTTSIRGIATALLHVVCAGIMGLYLGRAKFAVEDKGRIILMGLIGVSIFHGLYNFILFLPNGLLFVFPLIFGALIYLVIQLRKPNVQMIWKLVAPPKPARLEPESTLEEKE